jgi:hypothetical protein
VLKWQNTRTGNVLIRKKVFDDRGSRFDRKYLTGEDRDFFRRMIGKGHVFIWCDEAPVHETIPPGRWKKSFMVKSALLRGKFAARHTDSGGSDIHKTVLAVFPHRLPPSYRSSGTACFHEIPGENLRPPRENTGVLRL